MNFQYLYLIFRVLFNDLKNNRFNRRKFNTEVNLKGKVVVITGANKGIGRENVFQFLSLGAMVIMGCRDVIHGESVARDIRSKVPNANLIVIKLDLSSLLSVREFVSNVTQITPKIDILINNAGVFNSQQHSAEGFEMQFATNHLGHFLLTLLLINALKVSSHARVINVSSKIHMIGNIYFDDINLRNKKYSAVTAYAQSKLANILFTTELANRLRNLNINNIAVHCLHPGAVNTEITRHLSSSFKFFNNFYKIFKINAELGAQTTLYCALEQSLINDSGFYYDNCRCVKNVAPNAIDEETASKLWKLSCDMVKLEHVLRLDQQNNIKLNNNN